MLTLFNLILLVLTLIPLADGPPAPPSDLAGGSGWTGVGLLGAVLSWILLKHIPYLIETFKGEMQAERAQHKDDMKELITGVRDNVQRNTCRYPGPDGRTAGRPCPPPYPSSLETSRPP